MSYKDLLAEKNDVYKERLELVTERLQEISKVQEVEAPFDEFFKAAAERFLEVIVAFNTEVDKKSTVEKFYAPLKKEAYCKSFSNPAYAVILRSKCQSIIHQLPPKRNHMEKSYFSLAFFMFSSTIDIESKRNLPVFSGIFTKNGYK